MSSTSVDAGNVSIVIPCYNQGALLREALASVEQARNENLLEVVVVDDGSSDVETRTSLSEAQEAGYCVVPTTNRSIGPALNTDIRRAKCDCILPLASDNRLRDAYLNDCLF